MDATLSKLAQLNILGKRYGVGIIEEMVKVAMSKNRGIWLKPV
ncbi:hypothetical protein [Peribacillus sp. NPDC058002]